MKNIKSFFWSYKEDLYIIIMFTLISSLILVCSIISRGESKDVSEEQEQETVQIEYSFKEILDPNVRDSWRVNEEHFEVLDIDLNESVQKYIYCLCLTYGIDYRLVIAQIKVESQFQADRISSSGDYGLMQINKMNHEWISEATGVTDFLDPYENVTAGIYVLNKFIELCDGDVTRGLMSYNMGYEAAAFLWDRGIESSIYSEQVESAYMELIGE